MEGFKVGQRVMIPAVIESITPEGDLCNIRLMPICHCCQTSENEQLVSGVRTDILYSSSDEEVVS
jgi:hypothetical protein